MTRRPGTTALTGGFFLTGGFEVKPLRVHAIDGMPIMTRPIDETWSVDESGTTIRDASGYQIARAIELDVPPREFANAKLIAQAPAMARLLAKHEWHPHDEGPDYCIECGNNQAKDGGSGHASDCALIAVLRAAGVVE